MGQWRDSSNSCKSSGTSASEFVRFGGKAEKESKDIARSMLLKHGFTYYFIYLFTWFPCLLGQESSGGKKDQPKKKCSPGFRACGRQDSARNKSSLTWFSRLLNQEILHGISFNIPVLMTCSVAGPRTSQHSAGLQGRSEVQWQV
jgi:hypothetical protein